MAGSSKSLPHIEEMGMSDPTREEIDAKLVAAEARAETRFIELSGKIDRLTDLVTTSVGQLTGEVGRVRSEMRDVKDDNKNTRWTIVITVIVTILAALAALWTTQGNLISAFNAGLAVKSEPPSSPTKNPSQ